MTKKRPEVLKGETHKVRSNCGNFYLTINKLDGELFEIKIQLGKCGSCTRTLLEQMGILYSILFQEGISKEKTISIFKKHFLKVACSSSSFFTNGIEYTSCLDYVAQQVLKELGVNPKTDN